MDLYSPQLAKHSQPSKNNKRSTCTHPPKTKGKKKEFVLSPEPSKRKNKIVHNPQTPLPFPPTNEKNKFEDKLVQKLVSSPIFF
jgi:hypothetical protein